ncbi:MAG: hypothetical protein GX131_14045 [candidate division WS1 bacterium]|nr:hypothetical protein [candidate division WS1 bacterium]
MNLTKVLMGIAVAGLVLGGLVCGFATAAEHQCDGQCRPDSANWQEYLEANDANGDGMISLEEFAAEDHVFIRIDADGDGLISREEAIAAEATRHQQQGTRGQFQATVDPAERWQRMLDHVDADKSGTVSQDEFSGPDHAFTRLDADGDGQLTEAEVLAAAPRMQQRQDGEGGGRGARLAPAERWQQMLSTWDADESGTISREEFRGQDHAFDRLDADANGQITEEEALAAKAAMRQGGRGAGNRR